MRVSQLLTQLESLNLETEAAIERLDTAAAERDADEFATSALSRMRGSRPAAFRPTAGGSLRFSAAEASAAMEDDDDFATTVEGLAALPIVNCKAVLAAAGLMEEVDDAEFAAHDRRTVATSPVLAGIVRYLRALSDEKRAMLMSELADLWDQSQAAMLAQARADAQPTGPYG